MQATLTIVVSTYSYKSGYSIRSGGAQYREIIAESQHPQLYEGSLSQYAELYYLLRFILKLVI